ncbi:MAG: GTP-binding protein [Pseudomonadota bacterium]
MTGRKSVPTLTIGGFLGAGKTTLVNHLLAQADGRRIVVFVNDFGAINIDHALIETVEEDRIALSNGCVCCSLNDDLVRSMVEFCQTDRPDLFVIEASGVANPKALATTLQALEAAHHAHLQSRIYVLDAGLFGALDYADTEDLVDHAAASDLVVINKCDLAPPHRVTEIETLLKRSAPHAAQKVTTQAALSWKDALDPMLQRGGAPHLPRAAAQAAHTQFATLSFDHIPPLSDARLTALMDLLKGTCLRAKGFLALTGARPGLHRLQLVGQHVTLDRCHAANAPPPCLVVIGRDALIPGDRLSDLLQTRPRPDERQMMPTPRARHHISVTHLMQEMTRLAT